MRSTLALVVACAACVHVPRGHPSPVVAAPTDDASEANVVSRLPGMWRTEGLRYTFGTGGDLQMTYLRDGSVTLCTVQRAGLNLNVDCQTPRPFGRGPDDTIGSMYTLRIVSVDARELQLFDYKSSATMTLRRE